MAINDLQMSIGYELITDEDESSTTPDSQQCLQRCESVRDSHSSN